MPDDEPKIKVFASDDNLKALGELLSNDSSRSIIYHLMTSEMYTNELATKLDMRVSLVIHHLKKMEDLELLIITNKKIKRKGQEHRFFKIDSDIFVTVDKTKKELKEKGFLKKIFRSEIKILTVVFTGIGTWFGSNFISKIDNNMIRRGSDNVYTSSTIFEFLQNYDVDLLPIIITALVFCFGFIMIYCFQKSKKKRD